MTTVGFIGTGVMGKSMAEHILDAGFDVVVYNRTKKKADSLVERGAIWADSPALVTERSDVILSIVGFLRMSKLFILASKVFSQLM